MSLHTAGGRRGRGHQGTFSVSGGALQSIVNFNRFSAATQRGGSDWPAGMDLRAFPLMVS